MTTKADYTDEEWVGIVRAPILAGGYIAVFGHEHLRASSAR